MVLSPRRQSQNSYIANRTSHLGQRQEAKAGLDSEAGGRSLTIARGGEGDNSTAAAWEGFPLFLCGQKASTRTHTRMMMSDTSKIVPLRT